MFNDIKFSTVYSLVLINIFHFLINVQV